MLTIGPPAAGTTVDPAALGVTKSPVVSGVEPAQASECTNPDCKTTFEEAAEDGTPLIERGPADLGDLDAEMAAAPITEEELGPNEPEFTGALEEKEKARKKTEGMPRYREE
jgi:hypothetical protein